jgi:branched-chain amino acid transport system ATP-binding protein
MGVLLELHGVTAGYGGGDVLRSVDLQVSEGSITCVVGPNGAGKSTLLRVISGLVRPRRGSIRFLGQSLLGLSPRAILGLGIVQVPQERSLFPTMSVLENVRLGAYTIRDRRLVERRLADIQERFPLIAERAREPVASLSGGQQKLVELSRALMLDPRLVVLDEPSMGLDPRSRATVFETIGRLAEEGRTVLLVEQNARSGLRLATHGVVMESGRIRLMGPGPEVLANPEVAALYLGRAG